MSTAATAAEQPTLEYLQEQHVRLKLQSDIADLERSLQTAANELHPAMMEAEWGDVIDRREYLYDTPGFGFRGRDSRISRPDDRKRGIYRPFFENELDLGNIRGIGRYLCATSETGAGIIENLTNYTIGSGFTYEVQPVDKSGTQVGLVATAQSYVDIFTLHLLERESFIRTRRDGEWFLWIHEFQGEPVGDVIEPEFVTQPANERAVEDYCGEYGLDWYLGIASQPNRPARVVGYFVQWYGSPSDWDYVPACEMIHVKLNADSGVKRGISDFYSVYLTLERAAKTLGNTLQGTAIQAAIAYIRKHAAGTSAAQITNMANSKADRTVSIPVAGGGTKQLRQRKFEPGTIIDAGFGMDYAAGPLGTNNAPVYIEVVQAAYRVIGSRWAMPEYMVSGDASNANYASTLTAGGPFDRATRARQGIYTGCYEEAHWRALAIRCRLGHFSKWGIHTLSELKAAIKLHVTPPTVAIQDVVKEEEIRQIRSEAGILSDRTWANQADLDYDSEVQNGAKKKEQSGMGTAISPSPVDPPVKPVAEPTIKPTESPTPGQTVPPPPPAQKSASKPATITSALESVRTVSQSRKIISESYP